MKKCKVKFKFFICLILLLVVYQPVFANDAKEVKGYLKSNLDKVFSVLKDNNLDQNAKTAEVVKIVSPMLDFQLITKLSFGKKYWTEMPKDKQEQFVKLFKELLKKSFIEKLVLYTDEKIIINEPVSQKNKVIIPTILVSQEKNFDMAYKFYQSDSKEWKIYDLTIQDVSIIKTYQSQIDEILKKGTYEDLYLKLEKADSNSN